MCEKSRRIYKSAVVSKDEVRELLQFVFAAEILNPSSEIWIVSPWISNIPILDNRTGLFGTLDPCWSKKEIPLITILVRLICSGSKIILVTRPNEHSQRFIDELKSSLEDIAFSEIDTKLEIIKNEDLHTKGILTRSSEILGSMNLTYNGVEILDESIRFSTETKEITETRINFEKYQETDHN